MRYWLRTESRQPLESVACANPASKGCVRWGFVLAFHHLQRCTPFEQAIVQASRAQHVWFLESRWTPTSFANCFV